MFGSSASHRSSSCQAERTATPPKGDLLKTVGRRWNEMERLESMKRLISLGLLVAMTAATGALAVLPASPASAAPDRASVVTLTLRVFPENPNNLVAHGTLHCPAGDRLVGSGGGNGDIRAVFPTPDFTGATIFAVLLRPSSEFAFLTITCAPASQFSDVTVAQTSDHRVRPGNFARGVSRCPAGYYAFGGGGYFSSSGSGQQPSAFSNSSNAPSADGNAWTFSGVAPPGTNTLTVVTQCAPRTGRDFVVQFGPVSTGANSVTSAYVDCPAGFTAVTGGFYVSNPDGSEAFPTTVTWSVPASHIAGISSWFASGYAPVNTKVVALAQCLN